MSTRNSTLATLPGVLVAWALAESVTGELTTTLALFAGAEIDIVGGVPTMGDVVLPPTLTFTVTVADVLWNPRLSVACAVRRLGIGFRLTGSIFCFGTKVTEYTFVVPGLGVVAVPTRFPSW